MPIFKNNIFHDDEGIDVDLELLKSDQIYGKDCLYSYPATNYFNYDASGNLYWHNVDVQVPTITGATCTTNYDEGDYFVVASNETISFKIWAVVEIGGVDYASMFTSTEHGEGNGATVSGTDDAGGGDYYTIDLAWDAVLGAKYYAVQFEEGGMSNYPFNGDFPYMITNTNSIHIENMDNMEGSDFLSDTGISNDRIRNGNRFTINGGTDDYGEGKTTHIIGSLSLLKDEHDIADLYVARNLLVGGTVELNNKMTAQSFLSTQPGNSTNVAYGFVNQQTGWLMQRMSGTVNHELCFQIASISTYHSSNPALFSLYWGETSSATADVLSLQSRMQKTRLTYVAPNLVESIIATYLYTGEFGIGVDNPTAILHLKAGTSGAGKACMKFNGGVTLSSAEAGAVEWDGTNLYLTQTSGPTRKTVAYTGLSGTKVYYVSDSSGGTVNRKLTFTNGILTAET